jgi:cell division control protein 7
MVRTHAGRVDPIRERYEHVYRVGWRTRLASLRLFLTRLTSPFLFSIPVVADHQYYAVSTGLIGNSNMLNMATAVFSHHSSNPLEVGSSDQRNREYKKRVQREVEAGLSEDPCNAFSEPEIDKYHRHLAGQFPDYQALQQKVQTNRQGLVDLDDDDDMEDKNLGQDKDDLDEHEDGPETLDVDADIGEDDLDADAEADCDTDEEITLFLRPPEELQEIESEIADLEAAVPQLDEDYRILDRLGTGTFSSVYKAVDLGYHTKWDNRAWHGQHPPNSSSHYQSIPVPSSSKAFVAIKRIYVTSNPERIRNEISIMEDCRSCRHVSQIITAFRHEDQVVVVMPYHRNMDFRVRSISSVSQGSCQGIYSIHQPGLL